MDRERYRTIRLNHPVSGPVTVSRFCFCQTGELRGPSLPVSISERALNPDVIRGMTPGNASPYGDIRTYTNN